MQHLAPNCQDKKKHAIINDHNNMKIGHISKIAVVGTTVICSVATAIQLPSLSKRNRIPLPFLFQYEDNNIHINQQTPLAFEGSSPVDADHVAMPPTTGDNNNPTSNLFVSDILDKTRQVNIFASLSRDIEEISTRLNDKGKNTTVLAPLNSAVQSLPRKPWEDPEDYARYGEAHAYTGDEGEDRARRNLRRFVEAHLVPASPWKEGEEIETVGGGRVSWVKQGDKILVRHTIPLPLVSLAVELIRNLHFFRFNREILKSTVLLRRCRTEKCGS
jgi:hypothetical protein